MRTGLAHLVLLPFLILPAAANRLSRDSQLVETFSFAQEYIGNDFFNDWTWETFNDPTHGTVNYVDSQTAQNQNLAYVTGNQFVMKADSKHVVPFGARGRDSIRIHSNQAFDESVVVLDIAHMPWGCGTWPAFWSISSAGPWPNGGEIDIIEGVNVNTANLVTLHTTPGCSMNNDRTMSGTVLSNDCDAAHNFNQGCGVSASQPGTYGPPFNAAGGGWFVMSRSRANGIKLWFWSRTDSSVPPEVAAGNASATISPKLTWGIPDADFPLGSNCAYDAFFNAHSLVFDLTFCGDWAGSGYGAAGCPGNCADYVMNNPSAFSKAYWAINSLRVYTLV
ncbi:concanavalin A-like lectin/glucanase domain-containing protein [Epithele typhae]|uniref:concanavalin A-like lectin/glucanase domain-containing protein n=1 Tax=Epithele typhae TaxID=378194 RepID=UPI0020072D3C|nr:concanavalin A-like lectin/glucanase domain-containing protein [Epithele typhae]KAH9942430.1 concanavalin A-like lectin/glucanase domain-containing protein [Epithele typhae]